MGFKGNLAIDSQVELSLRLYEINHKQMNPIVLLLSQNLHYRVSDAKEKHKIIILLLMIHTLYTLYSVLEVIKEFSNASRERERERNGQTLRFKLVLNWLPGTA